MDYNLYKNLVHESEQYLLLVNTNDYVKFQQKFDKAYNKLKFELDAIKKIMFELKNDRDKFIKTQLKNELKNDLIIKIDKDNSLENSISKMDNEINSFNETIENYNFISRF